MVDDPAQAAKYLGYSAIAVPAMAALILLNLYGFN
jgi:hypothetical protein